MNKGLSNLDKAGRLLRLYGWLILIASIGMAASILLPSYQSGHISDESAPILYLLILFFILSFITLSVGSAVKKNIKWAKITSLFLSIIMLASPPLGTILALFIYYYLFKGWNENQAII